MINGEIRGACIGLWRKDLLSESDKALLCEYARYLNNICLTFRLRFEQPIISDYESVQVIKSLGYTPLEAIVVCGFFRDIFYASEVILKRFDCFLQAGAPEDVIPSINGLAFKIYCDPVEEDEDFYYLLDHYFVANYFNKDKDLTVFEKFNIENFESKRQRFRSELDN